MKLSYSENRNLQSIFAFNKKIVRQTHASYTCYSLYLVITCVFFIITTGSAAAQHCDASIQGVSDHPFGYRIRGDRCEGIYWEPRSDIGVIALVSLVTLPKKLSSTPAGQIKLYWKTPSFASSTQQHVRASSLSDKIFYRLDADRPTTSQSFAWPLKIIKKIELPLDEIGFLVMSNLQIGAIGWQAYIPVSVSQPVEQGIHPQIEMILVSDSIVKDISWRRYKLSDDGTPSSLLDKGLIEETFYSGELIKVILPARSDTLASYIEINAVSLSVDAIMPPSTQFVLIESQ